MVLGKIIAFFIGVPLLLVGCGQNPPYMGPHNRQELFTKGAAGATPAFNAGWKDGCASGGTTSSPQLQRLYQGFKIDEQQLENDEYYNGWNKGFRYCHRYLYQYHRKDFSN